MGAIEVAESRHAMRMLWNAILFLLLMAGLLVGMLLQDSASLKHPATWLFAAVGASLYWGITAVVYKSKPPGRHLSL